jgi:uncharacterized protein YjlB
MKTQIQIIGESGSFPNNHNLPLILYREAAAAEKEGKGSNTSERLALLFESLFSGNDWPPAWRDGIYPYHHYHSTAHEALAVFSGSATVQFGGDGGPVMEAGPGDVVVIPAGVAHKLLSSEGELGIVGAYPEGQSPDMQYGKDGERPASDKRIAAVRLPRLDPVAAESGPVATHWIA